MVHNIKRIVFSWQTLVWVFIFGAVRALSFWIAPYELPEMILSIAFLVALLVLYFKKPEYAYGLVMAEIFLGGTGHFLELFGVSIRTLLVLEFILLFKFHYLFSKDKRQELRLTKPFHILFGLFGLALVYATLNGFLEGNSIRLIIQDLIPYTFLGLILPTVIHLREKKNQILLIRLVAAFVLGSALFSLLTFILFSSSTVLLQEPYYKWFRDVVGGKITDLGTGFWRIVTPEHLFVLPLSVILASLLMKKEKGNTWLYIPLMACLFILAINLSRGYFLALVVALFPLLYKHSFKKWLVTSAIVGTSIFVLFIGTYFIASHGKSFGLEVFGLRLQSFATPTIEESTYTRSSLVKPILAKIQDNPLLGSGIGSTVTFINPVTKTEQTTPQFDWGYLEFLTEFGIIGSLFYFTLLGYILSLTIVYIKFQTLHPDFYIGLLGGLVALLVANLTAPALFHVFGILYIVFVIALIVRPDTILEKIKTFFVKIFRLLS